MPCLAHTPSWQIGFVPTGQYDYFTLSVAEKLDYTFTVTPITGAVYVVAVYASSASNYTIVASGTSSAGNNSAITLQVRSVVVFLYPCLRGVAWCGVIFSWCTV